MTAMKHLLNKTVEALRKHNMLGEGMNVCVCLSGGADSSVLLHVLFALRDQLGITLSACHFHHGIRGEEADRDQSFCRTLCRGYGVPFYTTKEDLPALQPKSGLSMEAFARKKRYQWFEELGKAHHIHRFATAHHLEDNAETVLFRVIRGTTVAGLSGIPAAKSRRITAHKTAVYPTRRARCSSFKHRPPSLEICCRGGSATCPKRRIRIGRKREGH